MTEPNPRLGEPRQGLALMSISLIPAWRHAWKFSSVLVTGIMAIFDAAYLAVPDLKSLLTPEHFAALNSGFAVAAIVFRVIRQSSITLTPDEKDEMINTALEQPEKASRMGRQP